MELISQDKENINNIPKKVIERDFEEIIRINP